MPSKDVPSVRQSGTSADLALLDPSKFSSMPMGEPAHLRYTDVAGDNSMSWDLLMDDGRPPSPPQLRPEDLDRMLQEITEMEHELKVVDTEFECIKKSSASRIVAPER